MTGQEKMIAFIFVCGFLEINAQQHPAQGVQRTFAETQFDLDPSLPSEEFINDAVATSEIVIPSQQQQQIELQEPAKPSTMVRSPLAPANVQATPQPPPQALPPEPQQQQQPSVTPTFTAPRAKPFEVIAGGAARQAQTAPPVAGPTPSQLHVPVLASHAVPEIPRPSPTGNNQNLASPSRIQPLPVVPQIAPAAPTTQVRSPVPQPQVGTPFSQNHKIPSPTIFVTAVPNPLAAPSIALGGTTLGLGIPVQRRISPASLWFNETLPSFDCSRDYRLVAAEFRRKFPVKTIRDVRDKRLAEVVEQRLTDCDRKAKSDHWSRLMKSLPKAKLAPSEEEECRNGLVQERIACVNLMSYTCQFVKHDYAFRLVPARVIMQEARLAEDGSEKCVKVVRFFKKHDQPK